MTGSVISVRMPDRSKKSHSAAAPTRMREMDGSPGRRSCPRSMIGDLLGQERTLGLVSGQVKRLPVGVGCLGDAPGTTQQVRLYGVQVLVIRQPSFLLDLLDFRERRLRAGDHCQWHGPIQRNNWGRPHFEKPVVQSDDLRPVSLVE